MTNEPCRIRLLLSWPSGERRVLPVQSMPRELLTLAGLRSFARQTFGVDAIVLHMNEVLTDLEAPTVRLELFGELESLTLDPLDEDEPLANARPWQRPGWFDESCAFLRHAVETSGDKVTGEVQQESSYDLACVLFANTKQGGAYLKAGHGTRETAVTKRLSDLGASLTVPVLAADEADDRLVTRSGGVRLSEMDDEATWHAAVRDLARFQQTVPPDLLRTAGCPTFDFGTLLSDFVRLLDGDVLATSWGQDRETVAKLRAGVPMIAAAHDRVLALKLPLLATHGDAQPMNVLVRDGEVRLFDFSEACVASPFLDVGWLLGWLSLKGRASLSIRVKSPDIAEALWKTFLDAHDVGGEVSRQDAVLLAFVSRVLAYERRFRGWEGTVPGLRPYVPYYLRLLSGALDAK